MSDIKCPKCGSTQIHADKRGFKTGRAVAGTLIAWPFAGLAAGGAGQNKLRMTCLACGHRLDKSTSSGGGSFDLPTSFMVGGIVLGIFLPISLWGSWWLMLVLPIAGFLIALAIEQSKKSTPTSHHLNDSGSNITDTLDNSTEVAVNEVTPSLSKASTASEIYTIGFYEATQFRMENEDEQVKHYYLIEYDDTQKVLFVSIDMEVAGFTIQLNAYQKGEFKALLEKVLEWHKKAIAAKVSIEDVKEVGTFSAGLSSYHTDKNTANAKIKIEYHCHFEHLSNGIEIDDCHFISISSLDAHITDEDHNIFVANVTMRESAVRKILDLISDENIRKSVELEREKKRKSKDIADNIFI